MKDRVAMVLLGFFVCLVLCLQAQTPPNPPASPAASATDDYFDTLTTSDGQTYSHVNIVRHDPLDIEITYDHGTDFIDFEKLPKEIQVKYGYDPGSAAYLESKKINDAIGAWIGPRWNALVQKNMSLLSRGKVDLKFFVHPDGSIEDPVLMATKGEPGILSAISIQAIRETSPFKGISELSDYPDGFWMYAYFQIY